MQSGYIRISEEGRGKDLAGRQLCGPYGFPHLLPEFPLTLRSKTVYNREEKNPGAWHP